jgi:hypothetical protein
VKLADAVAFEIERRDLRPAVPYVASDNPVIHKVLAKTPYAGMNLWAQSFREAERAFLSAADVVLGAHVERTRMPATTLWGIWSTLTDTAIRRNGRTCIFTSKKEAEAAISTDDLERGAVTAAPFLSGYFAARLDNVVWPRKTR